MYAAPASPSAALSPQPLSPPAPPLDAWMREIATRTEHALDRFLPAASAAPTLLHEAMRYATLAGGKRMRALLCHAAGAVVDADPAALDAAAAAIEMIHAYSLVHDDLPAMDNDALRRGKPTVHIKYGDANAILVGDGLQALAFETACKAPLPPAQCIALVRELAAASGSLGMVGGQCIDLTSTGLRLSLDELERMHRMKTGALFRAAVLMGAHCGAPPVALQVIEALERYQQAIGLAFQVVDDILDVTADAATLGKTAGKDMQANKPTYVSVLGLSASRKLAIDLREQARTALAPLGDRAVRLSALADLVVERAY
ncbi:polyprenyl synthetase family protein [Dyella sp. BiH032]|uniref:polyprenyl synthetase family protein n=1 Tax=Dyella sp. BiH032 TaxID=3075430 RepID=UPI00289358E8|nr:farnesyl diphosphate synthase [Dyella sp. BiH032]WNL44234.1 polyprenyl synthetase family protein [Dyella sp. BiH032]